MQRIRISLPYYALYGWDVEIVTVDENYTDFKKEKLLLEGLPAKLPVHKVKAWNKSWTSKFGLGSIALRSLWFYRKKVNELLKKKRFDLIFFSTTQFPVCILGPYWKKKFGIPYVIDMQDPWHSTYYQDKPKKERPPKHQFAYRLNKYLESMALKSVDGLMSVSASYISDLKHRFPAIGRVPAATIPFGIYRQDLQIANESNAGVAILTPDKINLVYIGRGGKDMKPSIETLFKVFKAGLTDQHKYFERIQLYFIGTSYAAAGQGKKTILPLAEKYGIADYVVEVTDRVGYFESLKLLQQADALYIPGSDDPRYTASKIYPYLLVNKPIIAIFNKESSAIKILQEFGVKNVFNYQDSRDIDIHEFLSALALQKLLPDKLNQAAVIKYSAKQLTSAQCCLFDQVLQSSAPEKWQ